MSVARMLRGFMAVIASVLVAITVVAPQTGAQSSAMASGTPSFVPGDAIGWVEFDLAALPAEADRIGDILVGDGRELSAVARLGKVIDAEVFAGTPYSLRRDILRWTDGRLVGAVLAQPAIGDAGAWSRAVVVGFPVVDSQLAEAFLASLREFASDDFTWSDDDVEGTIVSTRAPNDGGQAINYALVEGWVLAGFEPEPVEEAVRAAHGTRLAADAVAPLEGGAVARGWLDMSRLIMLASGSPDIDRFLADTLAFMGLDRAILPTAIGTRFTAGSEGVSLISQVAIDSSVSASTPTTTDLATHMPGDMLAYVEVHGLQPRARDLLARAEAADSFDLKDLEYVTALDSVEVLEEVRDVAIGIRWSSGDLIELGLAATVIDPDRAQTMMDRVLMASRVIARRDGTYFGDERVNGVPVVRIPSWAFPGLDSVGLPIGDTVTVALDSDVVLMGTGGFVEDALLLQPVNSLAAVGQVASLVSQPTDAIAFIDVPAVLDVLRVYGAGSDITTHPLAGLIGPATLSVAGRDGMVEATLHFDLGPGWDGTFR